MEKKRYLIYKICVTVILLTYFAGCNAPQSQLIKFNNYYKVSDFAKADEYAQSKIGKGKNPSGEDLLWSLQAASVKFMAGDPNKSAEYFDKAERMLNFYDYQNELAASVVSSLVNDNAVAYGGEEYDGIMVNTYKALDFMMMGKHDLARVEFNRALDRQSRAKEHFAKEISKLKDQVAKEEQKQGKANIQGNLENPQIQEKLRQQHPELYEYKAYPDFVNPFTTYLAGVYFDLVQDPKKAVDLLKEAHGMVPDNPYITDDLTDTENYADGKDDINNKVWVIFENGMGPTKEEFRIDLPLFIVTNKVKYIGIALPKLEKGEQSYSYLMVNGGEKQYRTEVVADMERVIRTEFNKDFQGTLTRAIISATVKAAAQYALEEQNSSGAAIASIAVAVYSFATTAADVRIWSTLPKDFQVARLKIPANRSLTISSPEGVKLLDINIPSCTNAIIYIKIPFKQALYYNTVTFGS